MASIKEISLPHGTIPTQMFGNVNLQNAVMYVNENFAAVKEGVNDAVAATNEAIAEKADGDHDHDDAYSALGHTHSQSEVIGLSSALDGKADLNHEHSQYLSSLPAHYHDVTGIQGLGEQLQAKAEKTHSHTMAQVENLSTELGVKASTAYVDQQVNAVGTSIKAIADQEIIDCGAAKEGTSGAASTDVPKDVTIVPSNETVAQKNARVGTANRWARADHKHVFETETDAQQISKLKHDGNGTDGAASFGEETIVPRIDHSHPLNVSSETPSDVVKSTGDASSGSSKYYARQDHVHKMPALNSDDIALGTVTGSSVPSGTVSYAINNHEGRIKDLEDESPGGGTVKSVDSKTPDESGDVALNALTTSNYSTTLDDVYQAKSEKLDGLDALLNGDGTIPSTAVVDKECTTDGDCLAYFDANKSLAHLGNSGITVSKANAMNECFDYVSTSGKATSGKLNYKAAGSSTAPTSAKVIGFEANASSASLMDAAIVDTGVSATDGTNVAWKGGKLVKDTNTYLKVNSSTGLVYSNTGEISYVGIGSGSNEVAAGNHTHAYGDDSLSGFGTAAAKNVGVSVNDVAAGLHVHGNITADGKLNGCSSANCFLVTTTNAVITHSNLAPKVSDVKELVTQWISAGKKLGAVSSVNGKTGAVSLTNTDVGAAATNHNHTTGNITDFSSSVGSLINSALTSYATQSWVTSQLSNKASQSEVDTLSSSLESLTKIVQQISSDYVTSGDLQSYATKDWVDSQGFVTEAELSNEFITRDEIPQDFLGAIASCTSGSFEVGGKVTWNGTALVQTCQTITVTQGLVTSIGSASTNTINTVTYSAS